MSRIPVVVIASVRVATRCLADEEARAAALSTADAGVALTLVDQAVTAARVRVTSADHRSHLAQHGQHETKNHDKLVHFGSGVDLQNRNECFNLRAAI